MNYISNYILMTYLEFSKMENNQAEEKFSLPCKSYVGLFKKNLA